MRTVCQDESFRPLDFENRRLVKPALSREILCERLRFLIAKTTSISYHLFL